MVELSILDYAQINEGRNADEAIQETIELAKVCDQNGFKRFWVAEHHNVPAFASSTPEILISELLNQTENLRIGSGGVMLPHYAPLKVAENFRMLSAIHPGRVDLGMGNTFGIRPVQRALNTADKASFDYQSQIEAIQNYLLGQGDNQGAVANPQTAAQPELFVLSSSVKSARMAAELGIGYTFGLFPYASDDKLQVCRSACRVYRENFKPSEFLSEPQVTIAPFLTVSDDEEEAKDYAKALDIWLLGKDNFEEFNRFPSVSTANAYEVSASDREKIERNRTRMIVGQTDDVATQLQTLAEDALADELLLIPLMPSFAARKHAVEILAEAFGKNR